MELGNEDVIHIKDKGIQYLQFKRLLEYDDIIAHCFTLPPLNFGNNDTFSENREEIIKNYEKICKRLKIDYKNVVRPLQIHSHNIKQVNKIGIFIDEYMHVDGLISVDSGAILSLTYADCIPLYFFDPNKKVISNIHSGWQGTLKRIGEIAAIKLINEYGCNCEDIICAMGPAIRKCHFEVDEEIAEEFKEKFSDMANVEDMILKGNKVCRSSEILYRYNRIEQRNVKKSWVERGEYNGQQNMHSM